MTAKDQLNILDRKIKQNKANYNLYRQNVEISALSSGDLDKYEYLTGKDLGYKPDRVQKAKFEYSPLGQVFNKVLKADEKSEELLKRLKNIEHKTDNQLRAIENRDRDSGIRSIGYRSREQLSPERQIVLNQILEKSRSIDYMHLNFKGGSNKDYYFNDFKIIPKFLERIYKGEILITEAERKQEIFEHSLEDLKRYTPRGEPYIQLKDNLLKSAQDFTMEENWVLKNLSTNYFH